MIKALGYATQHSFTGLKPMEFEREDPQANEVVIEVLYSGVCHSDIHQAKNEWCNTIYPCMPGHEVVGRVTVTGAAVTRHKVGDIVGVGCMVDSCRTCDSCKAGEENYCEGPNSFLATYNGPMLPADKSPTGKNMYSKDNTFGGYSNVLVVPEDFVLKIPASLPIEKVAPILCAGVTTFSPLRHWDVQAGDKVGVIGFGGLGDMAAKLAKAFGAEVVVFTTTEDKVDEAAKLGLTGVYVKDEDAVMEYKGALDFMISTIPQKSDLESFLPLLKRDGSLVIVGALEKLEPFNGMSLAGKRISVAGSSIGSIRETQEVLDFCAEHNVTPDVELIAIEDINDAYQKVEDGEVRFRYVIDMKSLANVAP